MHTDGGQLNDGIRVLAGVAVALQQGHGQCGDRVALGLGLGRAGLGLVKFRARAAERAGAVQRGAGRGVKLLRAHPVAVARQAHRHRHALHRADGGASQA